MCRGCEGAHSPKVLSGLEYCRSPARRQAISKDDPFDDCVILDKSAFDPDAVFLDDIVGDDILPRLSLAIDGLTEGDSEARASLEMPSDDTLRNQIITPSTTLPSATLGADILEVYGWESSLWRKIRGYLGF